MKKKTLIILSLAVLCAILVAGVTYAFFTASTETKTNTFTLGKDIAIKLAEAKWDNKDYDGNAAGITDTLGQTLAQNIVPGRVIPKNPSVKNASENDKVWIAIKLNYKKGNVSSTFPAIDAFADINFINAVTEGSATAGWIANASNTAFYYSVPVDTAANTLELFDKVTIQSDATHSTMSGFDIEITAYAVQSEGLTYTQAKAQLDGMMFPAP